MSELKGYFKQVDNFLPNSLEVQKNLNIGQFIQKFIASDALLEYYEIADVDKILSLHTRKFCKIEPTYVIFSKITGKTHGLLDPHKDHGPRVSLNYYIEAGEDKTVFYELKDTSMSGNNYPGKKEANIFKVEQLDRIEEFVAESNTSYLLNVSKIHSVEKVTDNQRIFLTYAWHDHSYEEVLESLC